MSGNLILKTGGDGLWNKKIKDVCVEKVELIWYNRINTYSSFINT